MKISKALEITFLLSSIGPVGGRSSVLDVEMGNNGLRLNVIIKRFDDGILRGSIIDKYGRLIYGLHW